MNNKILFLILFSILILFTSILSAEEESYTITTYYPSPYGSYNELSTNKFAVGDADGDGKVTNTDQPNRDGDIRLKPQTGDPSSWTAGKEGEIAYSATKDTLYVNNGSSWVAQGGGNLCYTKYNNDTGSCPTCPTGWIREDCLGVWGYCYRQDYSFSCSSWGCGAYGYGYARDFPPGGSCPSWWTRSSAGQAALCCKG